MATREALQALNQAKQHCRSAIERAKRIAKPARSAREEALERAAREWVQS
jgi:hypothetical protein